MAKFKVGDKVRVSGGEVMTVVKVGSGDGDDLVYQCKNKDGDVYPFEQRYLWNSRVCNSTNPVVANAMAVARNTDKRVLEIIQADNEAHSAICRLAIVLRKYDPTAESAIHDIDHKLGALCDKVEKSIGGTASNAVALNWKRSDDAARVAEACDLLVGEYNAYVQGYLEDVDAAEKAAFEKMHTMIAELNKIIGVFRRERK